MLSFLTRPGPGGEEENTYVMFYPEWRSLIKPRGIGFVLFSEGGGWEGC